MGAVEPSLFNLINSKSKENGNNTDKHVKKITPPPKKIVSKIEEKKDIERDNFIKFSWSWIL